MGKPLLTIWLKNNRFAYSSFCLFFISTNLLIDQKAFAPFNFPPGKMETQLIKAGIFYAEWFLLGLDTYYCTQILTIGAYSAKVGQLFLSPIERQSR